MYLGSMFKTEKCLCSFDRLLHSEVAKLTEECRRTSSDLEVSRQEVENLKHQLQGYVSEVRRIEELLARKVCKLCGICWLFISFHILIY
jgi:chromosome segregation ATPase